MQMQVTAGYAGGQIPDPYMAYGVPVGFAPLTDEAGVYLPTGPGDAQRMELLNMPGDGSDVSPNTLYYHFGGVADIARHALEAELDEGLVSELLVGAPIALDSGRARRMERVVLAARSGSAELTGMLAASLRALWLESAGVAEDDLDDAQRADLAFMFGGLVAMLGDEMLPIDVGQMAAFASRPLGAGAVATMIALEGAGSAWATSS